MEVKEGREYLLDGKQKVTVLKASNRSKTYFNVETQNKSIISVEKERLEPFLNINDPGDFFYPEKVVE